GYSSLRFRPIRTLSSAVENLRQCKVVGVIDKVQVVRDPATGGTFILKSLPKSHVETRERQTIIPHGVPFMVKLLCYYASEDSIFLHLEHVQGERGQHCLLSETLRPGDVLSMWAMACAQEGSERVLLQGGPGALSAPSLFLLCFPGETLWSHLRAKYRAQQGPSHGSGSLHSKATPAPRDHGRDDGEGSVPGSSQGSVNKAASTKSHCDDQGLLDSAPQEPRRGVSLTRGRSLAASGLRRAPASWGYGQRAWAVKEEQVQLWAAEILLALEGLHQQGVLCRDLNPRNLLLDTAGHVRLTFFGQWTEVQPQCCSQALEELYSAPEVGGIAEPTEAADCWSFGSLLYELLTGVPLSQCHPSGIHAHTQLHLPEGLSLAAASLLTQLLQHNPKRRLGSGGGGIAKLKSHSFFSTIPWNKLVG
ncbi:RPKL1 protein, partial [Chauna torquata]|nr:RPKL1 protein [Chauna torquata]